MNEFASKQASQRNAHRNLKSVGTLGTVGMARAGLAVSCSHATEGSGNGWEHNSSCEHKGTCSCPADLFPLKNTVGTGAQSEARVIAGCSHVPTVPTFFRHGYVELITQGLRMSLLADLFKRLEAQPEFQGARPETTQPDQLDTSTAAAVAYVLKREVDEPDQPDSPPDASDRRAAWRITLDGRTICSMVGNPITYSDALAAVRWRWPEANILEAP